MGRLLSAAGLTALILCGAQPAAAKPTEAQLEAIKANCRSDFMSNCWGVKRGGVEAFQCLKEHMASLSSGCQAAVKAATPAPAPAKTPAPAKAPEPVAPKPAPAPAAAEPAAPEPQQEAAPSQQTAPATEPETKSASPAPQQERAPAPAPKAAAAPPPQTSAPEAAPPAKAATAEPAPAPEASDEGPAIIGFIPPRKKLMVQRHCRQELETYCADIDVGQGRVLRCLFSHKSDLTPDCQGALAKLSN